MTNVFLRQPVLLPERLPVDRVCPTFMAAMDTGPVVLTAPTGSGKSTRVPVWCAAQERTVVVEPRRVACRALADITARSLEISLGGEVGYIVRDERRARRETQLTFVTPGVALRMLADGALDDARLVVDEFHERTLDVDLLVALAKRRGLPMVVMSATLDAERLSRWLDATRVDAEGRLHPVDIEHLGGGPLPSPRGLEDRVVRAVQHASERGGRTLVFLPGRAEIAAVVSRLTAAGIDALPLHGGLRLAEQAKVLSPHDGRQVVVSTNVAETSLTVPGVRTVIDAGLVRRTRYHHGRGYLTLLPVALDSADQRAGRAGRLGPGLCLRLWDDDRRLDTRTPPEIHRESLVHLSLAAHACGVDPAALSFPDAPKEYALEDAAADLRALGALDAEHGMTTRGRRMFGLPVDAHLGRLLVEAEAQGALGDAIDLVASLSTSRRLFVRQLPPEEDLAGDSGCDVTAHILAVREGRPAEHGLDRAALKQARTTAKRLRDVFDTGASHGKPDRRRLARVALMAWPRGARVARRRKRHVAWAHGGTETQLGRSSRVDPDEHEALIAFDERAGTDRKGRREITITVAMPVPLAWLDAAGRGEERVVAVRTQDGVLLADVERRYAGRILSTQTVVPEGDVAIEAAAKLIEENRWRRGAGKASRDVFEAWRLAARVGMVDKLPWAADWDYATWLRHHLSTLGVASGDDLALLEPGDVAPRALPSRVSDELDKAFPRQLTFGDLIFDVQYDPSRREAFLVRRKGPKGRVPPLSYLPRLQGWRVLVREASNVRELRSRRG
jgi:HrpA-like RNA helicase